MNISEELLYEDRLKSDGVILSWTLVRSYYMKIGWKVMGCSFNMELSISVFRYHSHCHMTTVSGISFKRGIKVGKCFTKKSTIQKLNMSPFRLFGWHCNSGWHLLCLGLSTQFVRFRKVRAKVWGVKPGLVTSVFYVSMAYCAYSIYFFHPYCSLPMLEPALLLLAAIFYLFIFKHKSFSSDSTTFLLYP